MFGKKNKKKTLVTLAVSAALVMGMGTTAFAAFGGAADDTAFTHSIETTGTPVAETVGLDEDIAASSQLTEATERDMPEYTVAQADALAKDKYALDKQLAKEQAVDAEKYLKTLRGDVSWKSCHASTYGIGDGLMGSGCADGSKVTSKSMGVAHKTLPLGTKIQIKYDGKIVNAEICDRGPYIEGRELDLQPAVAWALGFDGVGEVDYRVID